jgi:hypothetical protein
MRKFVVFATQGPAPHAADVSLRRDGVSQFSQMRCVIAVTEMSVLNTVFRYIK